MPMEKACFSIKEKLTLVIKDMIFSFSGMDTRKTKVHLEFKKPR